MTRISVFVTQMRALECNLLEELSVLESEYKDKNLIETADLIILTRVKNSIDREMRDIIDHQIQQYVDGIPSKSIILVWEDKVENLLSQFCKIIVIESTPLENVTNSLPSRDNLCHQSVTQHRL